MSEGFSAEDLERIIALENSFSVLALMCAQNFAHNSGIGVAEAARQFGHAAKSASLDTRDTTPGINANIARLFDHVETMAKMAEASMDAADVRRPGGPTE
ncbi:MAG: hypothetical protein AAF291_02475 [Pseudomonadota bacterium]